MPSMTTRSGSQVSNYYNTLFGDTELFLYEEMVSAILIAAGYVWSL